MFDSAWINRLTSKLAYTDYMHEEVEGGSIGTTFKNEMFESRFDMYHKPLDDWKGVFTLHYKKSDFEATGEEAFTPPSTTTMLALAWLEEKHFDDVLVQVGARAEHVKLEASSMLHEVSAGVEDTFTPISTSLGVVWNYEQGYNLGISVAYSQRAPSASEVFSNGAHIGTNTYELGALYKVDSHTNEVVLSDEDIELETNVSLDLTFRKFEGDFGFIVSAFYNHIDDYYYQRNLGLTTEIFEDEHHDDDMHEHEEDEHHDEHEGEEHHDEHEGEEYLPIYAYEQSDVDLYGIESEFIYKVSPNFTATVFGDYIRAKLRDGDNLPRIPPLRLGTEFTYTNEDLSATLTAQRYFSQNKISENETDANINFYIDGVGSDLVVFIKADNITNEEARVHSSFLKDTVPLPARGFSFGVKGSF